ncbi:MAG: glycerophosphodiester phosphodiesterase family protein, partial [Promethearchaeota archaeon]
MFLIGHRGTRLDFDENTIEAFKIALKFGAKIIEFDVRKLKDDN